MLCSMILVVRTVVASFFLFCFSFMTVSGGRNQVTPRLLQIKAILFIYSSGKQGYMIPQYLFKYDQTA